MGSAAGSLGSWAAGPLLWGSMNRGTQNGCGAPKNGCLIQFELLIYGNVNVHQDFLFSRAALPHVSHIRWRLWYWSRLIPQRLVSKVLEKNQHKIRLEKDLEPKEVFLAPCLGASWEKGDRKGGLDVSSQPQRSQRSYPEGDVGLKCVQWSGHWFFLRGQFSFGFLAELHGCM